MPTLDGVRGIAILLVLQHHLFRQPDDAGALGKLLGRVAGAGWIGVDLFFALSGFLITGILVHDKGRDGYLRNFVGKRVLRIFPLYFGFLLLVLVAFPWLFPADGHGVEQFRQQQAWYWTYLANVEMTLVRGDWAPLALTPLWSLCVEEHFYLFWPFVVLACSRKQLVWVCAVALTVSPLARGLVLVYGPQNGFGPTDLPHAAAINYMLTPLRLDSILAGSLFRLAFDRGVLRRVDVRRLLGVGLLGLVALGIYYRAHLSWGAAGMQLVGYSTLALVGGALIVSVAPAAPGTVRNRLFASPVLRFFGKYSYALYIFHMPVDHWLRAGLFAGWHLPDGWAATLPGELWHTLIATILSIALASWNLWEKHFLRLKSRLN